MAVHWGGRGPGHVSRKSKIEGAASGVWEASPLPVLNADYPGWSNYTLRQQIPTAAIIKNGSKIRFSFRGGIAEGVDISKCYVQLKGAGSFDFVSAPVQVLFSGTASVSIPSSTTVLCDDVTIAVTTADVLVISIYIANATDTLRYVNGSPLSPVLDAAYKLGDDATTLVASGYTVLGNDNSFLDDFEIYG
jgi:hypothetical protein